MNHEEKRFHAAVSAMTGLLSDANWRDQGWEVLADASIDMADALLEKLDPDGWIPHRSGDPMPCDEGAMCYRKYRNGKTGIRGMAGDYSWEEWGGGETEIVAWKPA